MTRVYKEIKNRARGYIVEFIFNEKYIGTNVGGRVSTVATVCAVNTNQAK